jgi:protoporphyrinogen oxidase
VTTSASPGGSAERTVIIGAGPAGLTAAWELVKAQRPVLVLEQDGIVGGISRTETYKGYRYDIGGHRFFTKVRMVADWWVDVLGEEFLSRPRLSRIYYDGAYFDYPLKPLNALENLGLLEALRCCLSYAKARVLPDRDERTFEAWVSNRFGKRLFEIFFKTYTEKVWGIPCSKISADWAAQRIKNLNLFAAVTNAFLGSLGARGTVVTSLIDEFRYPRLGPGQLWEKVAANLGERGYAPLLRTRVRALHHDGQRVRAVTVVGPDGEARREAGAHFISSMPIRDLVRCLDPRPPSAVIAAADGLRYRDFLTVGLVIDQPQVFPDNWIYIHSPAVRVGRIQNYKAWSPAMVPDESKSSLGLEYFVQEGDELWSAPDAELVELAKRELETLALVPAGRVVDGCVIRMPKAYPVYDDTYRQCLATVRAYLAGLPNLQLVGRNGQHRYNNQDHSMVTAIYAARNILGASYDVWDVNVEADYHEEVRGRGGARQGSGDRLVPASVDFDLRIALAEEAFARYHAVALGIAFAAVTGVGLFLATAVLCLKGGEVGPNLALLSSYFFGYRVTWSGALLGLFEGAGVGFVLGYALARLINAVVAMHERALVRRLELQAAFDSAAGEAP